MKLTYNVNDKPKFGQLIVFAIQQLLAIMAATLVVPVIVGHGMSTAAALFGAGVGTIVYLLFTGFKSPVFLGSSFAFLGSMAAAFAGGVSMALGYLGLIIGAVFAGLVYVVIAIAVKAAGVKWINKLMPAVVIGTVVSIIGLSLAGNAISDLTKTNYTINEDIAEYTVAENKEVMPDGTETVTGTTVYDKDGKNVVSNVTVGQDADGNEVAVRNPGSVYVAIVCGLITLGATMLASVYGKSTLKLIPFICGILCGYIAASIFFFIGKATGNEALMIINYAPLQNLVSDGIKVSTFFALPEFTFVTAFGAFKELSGSYIATIAVAYVPVAFVVFAEHIADHKNISSIIEKDLLVEPGLHRTLLGDGVGSMAGAFFGGCPNTTYGESIGCVAITGNASIYTIFAAAIGAIIISFLTPFVAFVNSIPSCVMGGVCMALYGFIAVSGLKMIKNVNLEDNRNLFTVSVILIAGIGGLSVTFGDVTLTTIACALILGVITNLILNVKKSNKTDNNDEE